LELPNRYCQNLFFWAEADRANPTSMPCKTFIDHLFTFQSQLRGILIAAGEELSASGKLALVLS